MQLTSILGRFPMFSPLAFPTLPLRFFARIVGHRLVVELMNLQHVPMPSGADVQTRKQSLLFGSWNVESGDRLSSEQTIP